MNLNKTELAMLKYIAADWTSAEIAEHLNFSRKTIRNYTSNIYRKLELPPALSSGGGGRDPRHVLAIRDLCDKKNIPWREL